MRAGQLGVGGWAQGPAPVKRGYRSHQTSTEEREKVPVPVGMRHMFTACPPPLLSPPTPGAVEPAQLGCAERRLPPLTPRCYLMPLTMDSLTGINLIYQLSIPLAINHSLH